MEKDTSTRRETVDEGRPAPVTFENATAGEMIPAARRFMTVKEVMTDMSISESSACKVIRQINDALKEKGKLTFRGRVLRSAYIEMTGGE